MIRKGFSGVRFLNFSSATSSISANPSGLRLPVFFTNEHDLSALKVVKGCS